MSAWTQTNPYTVTNGTHNVTKYLVKGKTWYRVWDLKENKVIESFKHQTKAMNYADREAKKNR